MTILSLRAVEMPADIDARRAAIAQHLDAALLRAASPTAGQLGETIAAAGETILVLGSALMGEGEEGMNSVRRRAARVRAGRIAFVLTDDASAFSAPISAVVFEASEVEDAIEAIGDIRANGWEESEHEAIEGTTRAARFEQAQAQAVVEMERPLEAFAADVYPASFNLYAQQGGLARTFIVSRDLQTIWGEWLGGSVALTQEGRAFLAASVA